MRIGRSRWWLPDGAPFLGEIGSAEWLDAQLRDPREDDWLEQELDRATARKWEIKDHLLGMGVSRGVLVDLFSEDDVGLMRVVEERDRGMLRWRPADEGERGPPRMILAVRDGLHRLLDLVAVSSVDPDTWSLRTGDGFILGGDLLDQAREAEEYQAEMRSWKVRPSVEQDAAIREAMTLRVFSRPIDMLIGGCAGICVLEWRPAALWALRSLGPNVALLADNHAAAGRLAELLRCGGLPEVRAARRERKAA